MTKAWSVISKTKTRLFIVGYHIGFVPTFVVLWLNRGGM